MAAEVFVGVLRVTVMVPHSRSLKDRRQAVRSLRDRLRSRFLVSVHELPGEHPGRQDLVCTTGGSDGSLVRRTLDEIRRFVDADVRTYSAGVDLDVFPWHPEALWIDDPDESEEPWNG